MTEGWPHVQLGDVLSKVRREERTEPEREYALLGAHWYAKGLYTKERKHGRDIRANTLYRVGEGDFVYNRLFAWMGSFALATTENDGCFVSNEFRCFDVDQSKLLSNFLLYYFSRQEVWTEVQGLSTGSTPTSRNRLSDDRFLAMRIPLPPLDEQLAVVAMLHGVTERVERAETERDKSRRAVRALGSSLLNYGSERSEGVPLGELVEWRQMDVDVEADIVYHFAGVYSFGRGVFVGPIKKGSEFSYKRLTRLHKDNFVYPKLMAWEGAFGVAGSEHEGLVVSPEFPVFELRTDRLLPETLQMYFEQPDVWRAISGASRGTNVRRRRLHPRTFLAHVIPLPSMEIQLNLRELVQASAQVAGAQEQVGANLAALRPSLINEFFTTESSRLVG